MAHDLPGPSRAFCVRPLRLFSAIGCSLLVKQNAEGVSCRVHTVGWLNKRGTSKAGRGLSKELRYR